MTHLLIPYLGNLNVKAMFKPIKKYMPRNVFTTSHSVTAVCVCMYVCVVICRYLKQESTLVKEETLHSRGLF